MTTLIPSTSRTAHLQPVFNWCQLSRADEVTVWRCDQSTITGQIDMVALDGSVFWIIENEGKGRAMIHRHDNPEVYRATSKAQL